jgi:hypothetical protein
VNWDRHVRFGGLISGRRVSAVDLGLVVNRHRWSRWCWRRCLQRLGGAFLPDQHADQEEDQGDADHHGGRGESPMGFRWFDLVEFLEQLACVKFSVVLGLESLNGPVDALSVGPAKQFCQLAGPVHGLLLDLNGF